MSLITFNDLSQSFGHFDIFSNVNGRIERGGRVGLVGPNGVGKTSLVKILAGLERSETGSLNLQGGLRVGYLRQEAIDTFSDAEAHLYDAMMEVFGPLRELEQHLRDLEQRISDEGTAEVLETYGDALEDFESRGGYDYELRIEQTLMGLGFGVDDFFTPVRLLSGGQKTRALLARLMLERPDLLILDEPTNHLDVQAVTWLEGALSRWPGALLVVSHDRKFLDMVANTIWALSRFGLATYKGNYSAYMQQRAHNEERATEMYEAEMERMWKEFDFIKRFKKDGDAQAVGRLRRLTRDLVAISQLGLVQYRSIKKWSETGVGNIRMFTVAEAEAAIKAIQKPVAKQSRLMVRLGSGQASGERVLSFSNLVIGYPDRTLFQADDVHLYRGQVAALVGPNGAGKTSMLKTLLGDLEPLGGDISLGHNVRIGYFAQAHENLDETKTVIDSYIAAGEAIGKAIGLREARTQLGAYLFRGDDAFKRTGDLSGGERGRLALAILSMQGANLLLLDEPTNHLDIQAQETLQEVLEDFEGTIVMVSHDRYLVDKLATHLWEVAGGQFKVTERALAAQPA